LEGASAEEAVPFPVDIHRRFALCRYYRRDTLLKALPLKQAAEEPATANGFREPRMQRIPRVDHDFHVNKIPIVAVAEGRGAQDMVALVPRR
jgi:hypothetical protein